MGESTAKAGERRKGMALARALFATYRGRLVLSGIVLIAENAPMVIQVILPYPGKTYHISGLWQSARCLRDRTKEVAHLSADHCTAKLTGPLN